MDFSSALLLLKDGHRVCRAGWNGKGMYLYWVPGSTFTPNRPPLTGFVAPGAVARYLPHIDMRMADGSLMPWNIAQVDVLADDWQVVDAAWYDTLRPSGLHPASAPEHWTDSPGGRPTDHIRPVTLADQAG